MPKLNWKLLTKKRGSSTQGHRHVPACIPETVCASAPSAWVAPQLVWPLTAPNSRSRHQHPEIVPARMSQTQRL